MNYFAYNFSNHKLHFCSSVIIDFSLDLGGQQL